MKPEIEGSRELGRFVDVLISDVRIVLLSIPYRQHGVCTRIYNVIIGITVLRSVHLIVALGV